MAAEVLRPRGVPLSKSSFYDPTRDFNCLDGSGSVPFTYVNDDYCDCQDGSDEPGTAACPNGFFHCTNSGHMPLTLPSSRVNDGVCDCCDTSDEYASGVNCVDVCRELGRAAREEAARQKEEMARGYHLRQEMVEDGKKRKKEAETKIEELRKEKEEAEAIKTEKEEAKKIVEEPEKEALERYRVVEEERKATEETEKKFKEEEAAREAFQHLDNDGDGVLTLQELRSRQTFDTNRDGQVTEEEARFYLGQEDTMSLETFLTSGWAMMRPVYLLDKRMFTPPSSTPTPEIPEELAPPPPPMYDEEDSYGTDDGEEEDDYDVSSDTEEEGEEDAEDYDPEDGKDEDDDDDDDEVRREEEEEEEEPKYDEETQRLVDAANEARQEFDEADRRVRDLTRELKSLEEAQGKDYGYQEEFRAMEGQCFEFSDREYIYRLCPFDKAIQKPKSGHGETRLGQWGDWTGPENNKYSRQLYSNGQACWNGPTRSADVHISCGTEGRITGVSEPNRCEYVFLFTSPAACTSPEDSREEEEEEGDVAGEADRHTEL
ncbi:hypothetical protein Pcinc_001971 [Petrolisthes cinctipes]|uniref:Glucosidase 2 subunit beta n=1 Tax=Petrolisthes cinctipes TaxID=88211 RepID=A0AAE1GKL7_PETCI|nr:hypothetical protein Pcinc_001971 [Petrolisthes cinctipes]